MIDDSTPIISEYGYDVKFKIENAPLGYTPPSPKKGSSVSAGSPKSK